MRESQLRYAWAGPGRQMRKERRVGSLANHPVGDLGLDVVVIPDGFMAEVVRKERER